MMSLQDEVAMLRRMAGEIVQHRGDGLRAARTLLCLACVIIPDTAEARTSLAFLFRERILELDSDVLKGIQQ